MHNELEIEITKKTIRIRGRGSFGIMSMLLVFGAMALILI